MDVLFQTKVLRVERREKVQYGVKDHYHFLMYFNRLVPSERVCRHRDADGGKRRVKLIVQLRIVILTIKT